MACTDFPKDFLVPGVTTHIVGNVTFLWSGVVWEAITAPLKHSQLSEPEAVGGHDGIYPRDTTVAEIASGVFSVDDILVVPERSTVTWDVVAGGTATGFGVLNAGPGKTAVPRDDGIILASTWGAVDGQLSYAALDDLKLYCAANKKTMYLDDDKTFLVDQPIVPVSNWTMHGKGTIKLADGADSRVIENVESPVVELEAIEFKDFTVDGNRLNQTDGVINNDGIKLSFVDHLLIHKVKVKNCGNVNAFGLAGSNSVGLSLHECINFVVSMCESKWNNHYNYQFWECVDGIVIQNQSIDPGAHCYGGAANLRVSYVGNKGSIVWARSPFSYDATNNAGQGMWFRQFQDCPIEGNTLYRQTDGVSLTPAGAGIQNGQEPSLAPLPQSPRLQNLLVPNQAFDGTNMNGNTVTGDFEFGLYGWSGKCEQFNSSGNTVRGCWDRGIIVTSGRLISSKDTVLDNGGLSPDSSGIWAEGSNHNITSPIVRRSGRRGIHIQGTRSKLANPEVDVYGTETKDYGIYWNDFSSDGTIIVPEIWTDDPATQCFNGLYLGNDANRMNITGGNLFNQPTASDAIRQNNVSDHAVSNVQGIGPAGGQKWRLPEKKNQDFFWVDATGDYRVNFTTAPTNDLDGVIVGTQM